MDLGEKFFLTVMSKRAGLLYKERKGKRLHRRGGQALLPLKRHPRSHRWAGLDAALPGATFLWGRHPERRNNWQWGEGPKTGGRRKKPLLRGRGGGRPTAAACRVTRESAALEPRSHRACCPQK